MEEFINKLITDARIITVAARPGVGKTAFMYNIISYLNKSSDEKILVNDLELSIDDSIVKLVSLDEEVSLNLVKENETEKQHMLALFNTNYENVIIDGDVKDIDTLTELIHQYNVKYVFIDYVQLMEMDNEFYLKLYNLAKYEELTIVILSQLSRSVDEREDRTPLLSDLNEELASYSDKIVMLSKKGESKVSAEVVNKHDNTRTIVDLTYNIQTGKFNI